MSALCLLTGSEIDILVAIRYRQGDQGTTIPVTAVRADLPRLTDNAFLAGLGRLLTLELVETALTGHDWRLWLRFDGYETLNEYRRG